MATTFHYGALAETAHRLVGRFGRDVQFFRETASSDVVPGKPWRGKTIIEAEFTLRAVVLDYSDRELTGELIRIGDRKALVAADALAAAGWGDGTTWSDATYPWESATSPWDQAADAAVRLSTQLGDEGARWNIVKVSPLKPGPKTLLFELQIRGTGAQ